MPLTQQMLAGIQCKKINAMPMTTGLKVHACASLAFLLRETQVSRKYPLWYKCHTVFISFCQSIQFLYM